MFLKKKQLCRLGLLGRARKKRPKSNQKNGKEKKRKKVGLRLLGFRLFFAILKVIYSRKSLKVQKS